MENDLSDFEGLKESNKALENKLEQAQAELIDLRLKCNTSTKKLIFTKNATEQKILETISNKEYYRDDPHLIGVYSATLNIEDFESDDANEILTPKKDNFLKRVEENIDKNDAVQTERYAHIKNQILDRVKASKTRTRSLSNCSNSSRSSSQNRSNSTEYEGSSPIRHKSGIPSFLKQ